MTQTFKLLKREVLYLDQSLTREKIRVDNALAVIAPKKLFALIPIVGLSSLATIILINKKAWVEIRKHVVKILPLLLNQLQMIIPKSSILLLRYFT